MPWITRHCRSCHAPFAFLATPSALHLKGTGQFCTRLCYQQWCASQEESRFWNCVDRCTHEPWCLYCCWPWMKGTDKEGYGLFTPSFTRSSRKGRQMRAHRRAWEFWNTQAMPDTLVGCHWCHNPRCVNPAHVFPGTPKMNTQHSVKDHRFPVGTKHPNGKVADEDITEIRRLTTEGASRHTLATRFSVGTSTIQRIVHYRSGKHVP